MIHICIIPSYRLKSLRKCITLYNKQLNPNDQLWMLIELARFDFAGIPISRIAFLCDDQYPPEELEIPIEESFEDFNYCLSCFAEGKLVQNCDSLEHSHH